MTTLRWASLCLVLLLTGAACAAVSIATGASPTTSPAPHGVRVSNVKPEATLDVFPGAAQVGPGMFARTGEWLWATSSGGIARIDPESNQWTAFPALPGSALFATESAIWQTTPALSRVTRFSPPNLEPGLDLDIDYPSGVDGDGSAIWVAGHHTGTVLKLDPVTGATTATITVGPAGTSGPNNPALAPSGLWVVVTNAAAIVRIDPATAEVTSISSSGAVPCGGSTVAVDAVWVSTCEAAFTLRVDPATNAVVAAIDVGGSNGEPVVVDGRPWVPVGNRLVRIDPATDRVDRILRIADGRFSGVATIDAFGSIWVGSADGRIVRLAVEVLR